MLFTWGMISGLIFLFAVPQGLSSRLQLAYASVFRWPLALGRSATLATQQPVETSDAASQEHQELVLQLQKKIANLDAQLQDVRQRNEQLARLREKPGWENIELRQARVLAMPDAAQTQLFINRGSEDGVAEGQFVTDLSTSDDADEGCVIGTVSSVVARTAKVRLITDRSSQIFVRVGSLSSRGSMRGQGDGTARITMIPRDRHEIRVGDPVYAEKQRGLDVPVITARVTSFRADIDNPFLWDIRVEPVCDITTLRDVAVVLSAPRPQ
jgi:rod shape-determining protein MreC